MNKEIDIKTLRNEINKLISDLENIEIVSENLKTTLKNKYSYISECSNTLFNLIVSKKFTKDELKTNVNIILENLRSVQNNTLDQYKASVNVGTHFADKYFPKQ
jgi:hypothetical protein